MPLRCRLLTASMSWKRPLRILSPMVTHLPNHTVIRIANYKSVMQLPFRDVLPHALKQLTMSSH